MRNGKRRSGFARGGMVAACGWHERLSEDGAINMGATSHRLIPRVRRPPRPLRAWDQSPAGGCSPLCRCRRLRPWSGNSSRWKRGRAVMPTTEGPTGRSVGWVPEKPHNGCRFRRKLEPGFSPSAMRAGLTSFAAVLLGHDNPRATPTGSRASPAIDPTDEFG